MKKNKYYKSKDNTEFSADLERYPEFIPSFDKWITMDEQRKKAEHIVKLTEEKD